MSRMTDTFRNAYAVTTGKPYPGSDFGIESFVVSTISPSTNINDACRAAVLHMTTAESVANHVIGGWYGHTGEECPWPLRSVLDQTLGVLDRCGQHTYFRILDTIRAELTGEIATWH